MNLTHERDNTDFDMSSFTHDSLKTKTISMKIEPTITQQNIKNIHLNCMCRQKSG